MHDDFSNFFQLLALHAFSTRPGHLNQVGGHFWTSSGVARVPCSLQGSKMIEVEVDYALYSKAHS